MKLAVFILSFVGLAYSSTKLDLTFINRALTRILDEELQGLANCSRDTLLCDPPKTEIYPICLDSPPNDDTKFNAEVDVKTHFILKIMNLELEGIMHLTEAQMKGLSKFKMVDVESTVTVVPLGIEFKFTLEWEGQVEFKSEYDFNELIYKKDGANTQFEGAGPMSVLFKNVRIDVVAHKLLGGKMDFFRITPHVDTFDVKFQELIIGGVNMTDYTTKKFDADFINEELDLELLETYIMDFFNDSLYPEQGFRQLREGDVLSELGKCIADKIPK